MGRRTRSTLRAAIATVVATVIATFVAAALLPLSAQAEAPAYSPSIYNKAFDAVVLRPVGLFTTIIGAAFLLPAVLVSIPNGPEGRQEAWDVLVGEPAASTFRRPLGDF